MYVFGMPKNLRRAPLLALLPLLALGLAACSPSPVGSAAGAPAGSTEHSAESPAGLPVVLTTFTVLADIAENVAGDALRVESITKVGAEIHGYEPTPGDIRRAADADLILDNGLGLEAWFSQFVEDLDVPHVVVSAGVETLSITEDAYAGLDNPHAWMSPLNGEIYVDNMIEAFSELSPGDAAVFAANGAAYKGEIRRVHAELLAALETVPAAERALVTCEGAFSYLARDAGLDEVYIWAVNAEAQATPQQITRTIDVVTERSVPAVFCESTVSDKAMQQVVEATQTRFGGVLYVDSLSGPEGPVPSYLELLRHDARVIVAGLTGGAR